MTFGGVIRSFAPGFTPGNVSAKINNRLYAAEFGAGVIQVFDLRGRLVTSRSGMGNVYNFTTDGKLLYGLVFSPKEVNAYNPRTLEKIRTLFTLTALGNPRGLAYTGKYFLVSDEDTDDVFVFDRSGTQIRQISYPAPFDTPGGLDCRNGYLFVNDNTGGVPGNKIWLADLDGNLLRRAAHPETASQASGGIVADGKYMWVIGRTAQRIYQCSVI